MKLLMIVFRDSIEEDVEEQLHVLGVTAYTRMDKVAGIGSTGYSQARFPGTQDNTVYLAALPDARAAAVVAGFRRFHDETGHHRKTHMPLHVFIVPCEQAL
jgi:hypothetical protein